MAPAMSVSTKQGDFQVWSNPALDKPSKSIPIGTVVAPREVSEGVAPPDNKVEIMAWLFLSKSRDLERVMLEFRLGGTSKLRSRCRFLVSRES
jgi:hypothetical protein